MQSLYDVATAELSEAVKVTMSGHSDGPPSGTIHRGNSDVAAGGEHAATTSPAAGRFASEEDNAGRGEGGIGRAPNRTEAPASVPPGRR